MTLRRTMPLAMVMVSAVALSVSATEDPAELQVIQKLDQAVNLDAADEPIGSVLSQLGESAGVPIELTDGAIGALPYGSQTKMTVRIRNRPLVEALRALLVPLGLRSAPAKDRVIVEPTPPLRRICRRATWVEVNTLDTLYSEAWSVSLFDALRIQFRGARADVDTSRETLLLFAQGIGAGSAADVLEHACNENGWTWFPEDERIVILPQARQIERQLEMTRVSLHYDQRSLQEALVDLTQRAGVPLRIDPGALAALPPQTSQRFSLEVQNTSVQTALELVAGETGLDYVVERDGVRVVSHLPPRDRSAGSPPTTMNAAVQSAVQAMRSNRIVGSVTIPNEDGTSFSFFIREDDLPPEVKQMREWKIKKAVNQIRQKLHAEQPKD